MLREPPLPKNGLPRPTSGVEVDLMSPLPRPSTPVSGGVLQLQVIPLARKSTANPGHSGLAKLGWFRMLKKSARSCMFTFSVSFVSFTTEKSQFLKVGPFRALRPRLPKCWLPVQAPAAKSQGTLKDDALMKYPEPSPEVPAKGSPTTSGRP